MKLLSYDVEINSELYNEDGTENDLKNIVPSVPPTVWMISKLSIFMMNLL